MNDYQTDTFRIYIDDDNIVQFSGTIELGETGYTELQDTMKEIVKEITTNPLVLNLKKLEYLNSKGIRFLIEFLTKYKTNIKILIDKEASWQKTSIAFLAKLAPGKIEISD